MLILALETSAKAVSVALVQDGVLLGEYYQNSGQTHSRTLMKLAQDLLCNCDLSPSDVTHVAYANGPGSFTGIRIGAAAAKGFCWGAEVPCLPVSTLLAMARLHTELEGIICPCMDARRSQVYNALFRCEAGTLRRLRPDRALSLEELSEDLAGFRKPIYLVGDGALLTWQTLNERHKLILLPEHLRQQRAAGVALAGYDAALLGQTADAALAVPNYLRLSQAERERLARENEKGE